MDGPQQVGKRLCHHYVIAYLPNASDYGEASSFFSSLQTVFVLFFFGLPLKFKQIHIYIYYIYIVYFVNNIVTLFVTLHWGIRISLNYIWRMILSDLSGLNTNFNLVWLYVVFVLVNSLFIFQIFQIRTK